MRYCFVATLLLVCASSTNAQVMHSLEISESSRSETVTEQGIQVTVQELKERDYESRYVAVVEFPQLPLKIIDLGGGGFGAFHQIGIGKLSSSDEAPSVIIKSYTGGAHCCFETKIVEKQLGNINVVELGSFDASADFDEFPKDFDGDGVADFIMADGAFAYAFTNYAASWLPPKIRNIYKGNVIDVSDQPGFRPIFEEFSGRAKSACSDQSDDYRNGACAAFVASEARLGRLSAALEFAAKAANSGSTDDFPSECRVALVDYKCPAGELLQFYAFNPAVKWFLEKNGYIR